MIQYAKYLVKENDQFDPRNFLFVEDDLQIIREQTEHVSSSFRGDILVAFMRDHSLKAEWQEVNPELAKLVMSGSLSTHNLEALFDSSRNRPSFREQMETFIKEVLSR